MSEPRDLEDPLASPAVGGEAQPVLPIGGLVPLHAALACGLAIVGYFVIAVPAVVLTMPFGRDSGWFLAAMMVGMLLANLAASAATTRIAGAPLFGSLRLVPAHPMALAGGAVLGLAAYLFNASLVCRLYNYDGGREYAREVGEMFAAMESSTGLLTAFLLTALLVPFGEEVLFRGAILGGLEGRLARWPAILVSSIIFGLFHVQPVHALIAFGLGLLAGWAAIASGSLWPAVAVHAVNNGLGYFELGVETVEDGLLHPIWAVVAVVLIRFGSRWCRARPRPVEAQP